MMPLPLPARPAFLSAFAIATSQSSGMSHT
jgi:hypothetical protein